MIITACDHEPDDPCRCHALAALDLAGAVEGTDWRWADSPQAADDLTVIDTPGTVGVYKWDETSMEPAGKPPPLPTIEVSASAVRKLGGRTVARAMQEGRFPPWMPFATALTPGDLAGAEVN